MENRKKQVKRGGGTCSSSSGSNLDLFRSRDSSHSAWAGLLLQTIRKKLIHSFQNTYAYETKTLPWPGFFGRAICTLLLGSYISNFRASVFIMGR
jgi:hypothetical protein